MIKKCSSADPKEKSTFSETFNKFSSKDDETQLLDDVDVDEFINKSSTTINELINKIDKGKNKYQNYIGQ